MYEVRNEVAIMGKLRVIQKVKVWRKYVISMARCAVAGSLIRCSPDTAQKTKFSQKWLGGRLW